MTILLTPIHGSFFIGPQDSELPATIDGSILVFPAGAILACRGNELLRVYPPGDGALEMKRATLFPGEAQPQ